MTKIYTKKGDAGTTSFYTGEIIKKNDPRIEAVGHVDELNSLLGLVMAHASPQTLTDPIQKEIHHIIERIQHDLFTVGAELTMLSSREMPLTFKVPTITAQHIIDLEKNIDEISSCLMEQKSFLLPGGSALSSWLHFSRTVARRAEREIVSLTQAISINPELLKYLNRLSDLLYVLARYANKEVISEQQPIYKYFKEN